MDNDFHDRVARMALINRENLIMRTKPGSGRSAEVAEMVTRRELHKSHLESLERRRKEQAVRMLPKAEERELVDAERQREGAK